MSTSVSRVIPADPAVVWALLTDTRRWPEWGPTVAAVEGPERIGPGATGRVRTPIGVWLSFEVTGFDDGHRWSWRVAGVGATDHIVEPAEHGATRVTFTAPTWAIAYRPVLGAGLRRIERLATGSTE